MVVCCVGHKFDDVGGRSLGVGRAICVGCGGWSCAMGSLDFLGPIAVAGLCKKIDYLGVEFVSNN